MAELPALSEELAMDSADIRRWKSMLAKMPKYETNEDGAIKEWQHSDFEDNYFHRHLFHIYPLFLG